MKSNHNGLLSIVPNDLAVTDMSKIQNEIKSQQYDSVSYLAWLLLICQRYKMKSNHNIRDNASCLQTAVTDMSKIQNEIKSQLSIHSGIIKLAVTDMSKIQNEIKSQLDLEEGLKFKCCY